MKKLIVLIALSALFTSSAFAEMGAPRLRLNALAGMNYQSQKYSPEPAVTWKSKGALSYGATIEFAAGPVLGIETGLFMNDNKRDMTSALGGLSAEQKSMEIPLMFRLNVLPILDVGVGGYYEKFADKATASNSTFAPVPNGTSTGNGYNTYGAKAGVRARLPLAPTLGVLLDASYKLGLKNTSTSGSSTKESTYALMAGISIGI